MRARDAVDAARATRTVRVVAPPAGTAPEFQREHFACPHCHVDASMTWTQAGFPPNARVKGESDLFRATCRSCGAHSYWAQQALAWPNDVFGEDPHEQFPEDLIPLYNEARSVAVRSPRAAAALLRLLVDELAQYLGATGDHLNERIRDLEAKGMLTTSLLTLFDAVRITGNRYVHEGQMDADGDDKGVVEALLRSVNVIVDIAIALPKNATKVSKKPTT